MAVLAAVIGCGGSDSLELPGTLERRALEVSAPISEIIVDLPVKVGDHVSKGTIIVQLDTAVAEAELRAHEASLSAAKALLKETTGEFNRQARLRRAQVATTQAYDQAKRRMDEAISLVAQREAEITQTKKRLSDLTIRARANGMVDQLPYEAGERVPAGGVVAVVIADDNPWVRVWLPSRAVARVQISQDCVINVEGLSKEFKGKVEYVAREPEFTPHYSLTERESAHLVYETKVRMSDPEKDMPAGIPSRVTIKLKKH